MGPSQLPCRANRADCGCHYGQSARLVFCSHSYTVRVTTLARPSRFPSAACILGERKGRWEVHGQSRATERERLEQLKP